MVCPRTLWRRIRFASQKEEDVLEPTSGTDNASPSGWLFHALSRWIAEPWIAAWYAREWQANGLCPKAFHAGAFCAGCWKCLKSSNLALALMIQSLLDVAGSPGVASFVAVVIAYVWCTQGVPRRIRAAKKRKKPSKTGLGWFTAFRRKEAPAGFEPAMADLQSVRNCVVSGGHVASWSA